MSAIKVSELSVSYGKKQVIHKLSFDVEQGELFGVVGANGSGKSTLIKAICNILPYAGKCYINAIDIDTLNVRQLANVCSYVPQKSGLSIEMTVLEVVMMGFNPKLRLFEEPNNEMIDKAKALIELTDLKDKLNEDYLSLSEGQKQLCILLRALVNDSSVILMDEPESALDINVRHKMMKMITKFAREKSKTMMIALHDIALALNFCDRILLISGGSLADIIDCKRDTVKEIEMKLSKIYGKICLRQVEDYLGKTHLVMLKEEEE